MMTATAAMVRLSGNLLSWTATTKGLHTALDTTLPNLVHAGVVAFITLES